MTKEKDETEKRTDCNGLERVDNKVIPCFETDGESMDVYIACK